MMCSKKILQDLPSQLNNCKTTLCNCTICYRKKYNHPAKGPTTSTEHLAPGSLLHVDFYFYDITSIRGFNSNITIIDAKTRKLWCFPGPDKNHPL